MTDPTPPPPDPANADLPAQVFDGEVTPAPEPDPTTPETNEEKPQ